MSLEFSPGPASEHESIYFRIAERRPARYIAYSRVEKLLLGSNFRSDGRGRKKCRYISITRSYFLQFITMSCLLFPFSCVLKQWWWGQGCLFALLACYWNALRFIGGIWQNTKMFASLRCGLLTSEVWFNNRALIIGAAATCKLSIHWTSAVNSG